MVCMLSSEPLVCPSLRETEADRNLRVRYPVSGEERLRLSLVFNGLALPESRVLSRSGEVGYGRARP